MFSESKSLLEGLFSDDPSRQFKSAAKINTILAKSMSELGPLDTEHLIRSGVIPRLVHFLGVKDFPKLHYEAACGLTSIAAYRPDLLVAHNVVPILVELIASNRDYVREQAIRALCNVAGHPRHRDYVLDAAVGALMPLLDLLSKDTTNLSMLRFATLTLSHLCRGMSPPTFDQVKHALELHLHSNDEKVLGNVCSGIQYVCDGSEDGIQSVIDAGFVPILVEHLRHPSPSVLIPVLHTIGTIVNKCNHQIQCVINCGALRILSDLFNRDYDKNINGATFFATFSITAGFTEHIQLVIDANWIPRLVSMAHNDELGMKSEAVCAISNVTSGVYHDQIKYLVEQGCIKPLCDLLVYPDPVIISACLNGLENILKAGEVERNIGDVNNYTLQIEYAEGLEKIENLQRHKNNEIYEKALKILETYWGV
ncbi:PREDICTED: importin subunit alpha-8-like [Camelina sativa]|uniref:Importin subunit alpha-8-like n=1 Tax=Camelina sativa TaxID=90675 RepID=A0ABM0UFM8_CAMSA|nr:PREDICTED: importin subunit alpha-8-like [Camelina sativa]